MDNSFLSPRSLLNIFQPEENYIYKRSPTQDCLELRSGVIRKYEAAKIDHAQLIFTGKNFLHPCIGAACFSGKTCES